jgi:hypothetical protein
MREVPRLAAGPLLKAGEHQLRAHGSVTDETAFAGNVVEEFFHQGRLAGQAGCAK